MNNTNRNNQTRFSTWSPATASFYAPQQKAYMQQQIPIGNCTYPFPPNYNISYGGNESPPSSAETSVQGSPKHFSISSSFSGSLDSSSPVEDILSNVSSPGDDFAGDHSGYFSSEYMIQAHNSKPGNNCAGINPGTRSPTYGNNIQPSRPRQLSNGYSIPDAGSRNGNNNQSISKAEDQQQQQHQQQLPVSPVHRNQKPNPGKARNGRSGGGRLQGQQKDNSYIIQPCASPEHVADDDFDESDDFEELETTLGASAQFAICRKVDERLRCAMYRWLVRYKFEIPRRAGARDIETPNDRDYEGFSTIINELTAKRWVPRDAVHHERIAELNTVLAGPAEIRHMLAHPERHLKSDWRMLGLIAAAIEVCKILKDRKGYRELRNLYQYAQDQISDAKAIKKAPAASTEKVEKETK